MTVQAGPGVPCSIQGCGDGSAIGHSLITEETRTSRIHEYGHLMKLFLSSLGECPSTADFVSLSPESFLR